jgi:multiple sugar transport system substrate-binding protein
MGRIRFLGCDQDAYCASVARHVAEFEEASGHQVDVQLIDNDEYFSNQLDLYLGGEEPADVYVSGPVLMWEQLGKGFVEPLDHYLARASNGFDVDDFIPTLIKCNRWAGALGEPLGTGALLEIPVNCESYNLAYLPEILDRAEVDVPRTWEEYFATARSIVERAVPARGFGQRGADEWHTIYTGFASQLWAYGGRDFDETGKCVIDSPEALRATRDIVEALHDAGPKDWLNQRWYELAMDFAHGDYGLIVDSDHYVAFFENPENSSVHGQVEYALPPLGPNGKRSANVWTWSAVMNARSRDKDTSWAFMEWATGRDFLLRSAFEGNMNPTRNSIWDHQKFRDFSSGWGDFADVSRQLVEEVGTVLVTPAVNYIEVARRWTRALRTAYADPSSLETILAEAATEIDRLVAS